MQKEIEQLTDDIYHLQGLLIAMEDAWEKVSASEDPIVKRYIRPFDALIQLAKAKAETSFDIVAALDED
ncbi:hypothetical protein ACQKKE_00905 [Desemzia incerta]|uniref:hypothetical protein n=1 Tax=Desemzia incerta TaxID=82801 RepID=UPI003CFFA377